MGPTRVLMEMPSSSATLRSRKYQLTSSAWSPTPPHGAAGKLQVRSTSEPRSAVTGEGSVETGKAPAVGEAGHRSRALGGKGPVSHSPHSPPAPCPGAGLELVPPRGERPPSESLPPPAPPSQPVSHDQLFFQMSPPWFWDPDPSHPGIGRGRWGSREAAPPIPSIVTSAPQP